MYLAHHKQRNHKETVAFIALSFFFDFLKKIIVMVASDCLEEQEINMEGGGGENDESLRKEGKFVIC